MPEKPVGGAKAASRAVAVDKASAGDAGAVDDPEMEAVLRSFVATLTGALPPRDAEVVWRVEILRQPPAAVARALGIRERTVALRLQAGRGALLHHLDAAMPSKTKVHP